MIELFALLASLVVKPDTVDFLHAHIFSEGRSNYAAQMEQSQMLTTSGLTLERVLA